jgi:beta-glucosidase
MERTMPDSIDDLLARMTLQEKVSLLAGADFWHTVPIERLGIPSIKVTDGPNGARGAKFSDGTKAACFPVGIALAASWNTELVERVGQALGQEVLAKGARVHLAPTVNIHRSPLNGRNFECYSEDPYLTARIAIAYINGVQSQGVSSTIKHFVCNDSEFQRNSISSDVGERALREIYLAPFQATIKEARPWAIMTSYNKINGTFASENTYTITDILRQEWGFDGVAMSDWFGTQSTAPSASAGLDLEMPGPALWRGQKLVQAVELGLVAESTIDKSVLRLLEWITRVGGFAHPEEVTEHTIDTQEQRALIREAGAEGIVLLKNEASVLPLQHDSLRSLAIIGPNAKTARIMAGGSAEVNPYYAVTPFDGISAKISSGIEINYEPGCTNYKQLPTLEIAQLQASKDEAQHGLTVEYFNSSDLSGSAVAKEVRRSSDLKLFGGVPAGVNPAQYSLRCTAYFTPESTGEYAFGLSSAGLSRLSIDGKQLIDNWTHPVTGQVLFSTTEVTSSIQLVEHQQYLITLEYATDPQSPFATARVGCLPPLPEDAIARAVEAAKKSDVALVFVGLSGEWESEGFDRPDLKLPGRQVELIEQVAAANEKTVVVLNTGSPIAMPWLDRVAAVLQAWYPGQECGNAIADVLFGDVNPSGKLTETFPQRLEDNPAYINYPGENGHVHYGEGLFVGYRYYEKRRVAPLFPFGFGLSYTTFEYSNIRLSETEIGSQDTLQVSINVTNTGSRAGKEVVQLYVHDSESHLHRPEKELKGFAKVALEPGETKTVTLALDRISLAYYDDLAHEWVAEAGEFELLVGASSQDIRARAMFHLSTSTRFH